MAIIADKSYVIRHIADEILIFPIGEKAGTIHGGIRINEVAEFIWNNIQSKIEINSIVSLVIKEYDVEYERAMIDVEKFIDLFVKLDLIIEL